MNFDIEIAARTCWMEARSQGKDGMRAVANVIVNRFRAGRWFSGKTLAETCLLKFQFSCWNTVDPNRIAMARLNDDDPVLAMCRSFIKGALDKTIDDNTNGATHYYNPSSVPSAPEWVSVAEKTATIKDHVFFKKVA